MNGTPRLRSSYPSTPGSLRQATDTNPDIGKASRDGHRTGTALLTLPTAMPAPGSTSPVIPVTLVDAPSQRMYTSVVYVALFAYRLYDYWSLFEEDTKSVTLFVKWCFIDLLFFFGVPLLRIPWLEWSDATSVLACLFHIAVNGFLMFRIPLPIEGWLVIVAKTLFDREMSISENSVRPGSILHNSSHIMGKHIINILPEGSVTMNPDRLPFCLNSGNSVVQIPLLFNQTNPKYVELLRIDFDTNANESIILSTKEMNNRRRMLDENIMTIHFTAKKPGLYRLHKVVDRTKLEVQRKISDTLVVSCPRAAIRSSAPDKCLGDLSDLTMTIEGTPPLKVVYSRTANSDQSIHHFQSIQPENFASPLVGSPISSLVGPSVQDTSWGRNYRIKVPLNESMMSSGLWLYSINEIHDATGNIANFSSGDDGEYVYPKGAHLEQALKVHERPVVHLFHCDPRNPLMVAKGHDVKMPIDYRVGSVKSLGGKPDDTSHTISWRFSALETISKNGDHGTDAISEEFIAKSSDDFPTIREPGLYTITGVRSKYCEGVVEEPASCLLLNPPEPELTLHAESISDKCAGNPIGLLVDLDLIGTPPFVVRYDLTTQSGTRSEQVKVPGLRHQLELKPKDAGHFKYQFTTIDDAIYTSHTLSGKGLVLEQDVKPPASAELKHPSTSIDACIEEPVDMIVTLSGEQPFVLEYELIHDGKRKKSKVTDIKTDVFNIKTEPLLKGGEYTLAITSIQDKTGCKIFLNSEAKFTVRRQRPKAAFGKLEGSFNVVAVEGEEIELPLRLTGQAPWTVKYREANDPTGKVFAKMAKSSNDMIKVNQKGKYEILEVSDDQCPGTVDPLSSNFEVDWLPRPQIKLADTAVLIPDGKKYVKREVCEGDIDTVEVSLIGSSPYNVKYQVRHQPTQGSSSIINKEFEAALGSATIPLDTTKPGTYKYKFLELSDVFYDHDGAKFTPLILEQKVNRKPSAYFVRPGQSYKYCKEELDGDEFIPIKLEGVAPFSLEVDIKHQSNSRTETVKIANIETNHYNFRIPHRVLSLGIHQVTVHKVRDSHGCQQKMEQATPHVQVQLYDVPTIYPLDSRTDYCVGDRISYTLSGTAPFEIFYEFEGIHRKAKSTATTFKRFAEKPGNFTIAAVADKASECKARTKITKIIHEIPSVKVSKGRQLEVDIHEGGEAAILFEFWGSPPFEFTYTRSTNARKGQKSQLLETRHDISYEYSKTIQSSQEGTYEVVAIKDRFCSFSTHKADDQKQRLLQF